MFLKVEASLKLVAAQRDSVLVKVELETGFKRNSENFRIYPTML